MVTEGESTTTNLLNQNKTKYLNFLDIVQCYKDNYQISWYKCLQTHIQ